MAMSKLDVAVVIVAAAVLLRIEHDHRIFIGTPAAAAPAAAVCPAKDDVPFSADCIKFIEGGAPPIRRARLTVVAVSPDARDDPHGRIGFQHARDCAANRYRIIADHDARGSRAV